MQKAAESIGWRARIIDTKFNPAAYGAAIRQAIAAGADGIVVYAGDCAFARPQLAEARQAGIPVVGVESVDCDESDEQEKPEFAATVEYEEGSFVDWTEAYARAQAAWAIAHTGGEAKVLMLENEQTLTLSLTTKAFARAIEACSGRSIVGRVPFTLQDVGSALAEKAQQALLQAPEANVVYAINDTFVTGGVAQAVAGSGRDVAVVGGEGFEANADLVREGRGQSAGVGSATAWEGFAAVDTLNRLFDGKRPAPSGIGLQVYDADHNLPASGPWEPPVDFEAAYDRAWHVQ
jgi:ribose transport system substrate-binding protein